MCTGPLDGTEITGPELTAIYGSLLHRRRKFEAGSLEYVVIDGLMEKLEKLNALTDFTLVTKR